MGFTFDDTDTKGVATSLAEMRRLDRERPAQRRVIFPYIGGEEVNDSPTHAHHRYVINFGDDEPRKLRRDGQTLMANRRSERLSRSETSQNRERICANVGGSLPRRDPAL